METKPTGVSRPADASLTFWRYFLPFWVAFGVVKIIQICLYPDPYLISDTGEYLWSAHTLRVNPYKPFGYSLFLAGCRFVLPFPLGVAILQSLLRLGATTLLGVVLRRHYALPRNIVLAGCLLIGLDPLTLFLDHHLLSDSLFISATVVVLAGALGQVRDRSGGWLAVAVGAMGVAIATRFVGLVYPALLLMVILIYPGRGKMMRAGAVIVSTIAILAAIATVNRQELGVFQVTTFDGWALYGNIGGLIDIDVEEAASVPDPETRLLFAYFAAFPIDTKQTHTADWYRWNPRSPAKQLLYGFVPRSDAGGRERAAAAAVDTFVARFDSLARIPTTRSQRLYRRYRQTLRSGDPDRQPYHHAFVLVNEFLRTFNRAFMRRQGSDYLASFYLHNVARVFAPRDVLNRGAYRERWEPDQAVAVFWPGTDTTRWRPRFGDVAGAFGGWCRWYISLEWLLAAMSLGWCLAGRPPRPLSRWKRLTALGVLLFVFAVGIGLAVAFSHNTQTRYLAPILPFLIVSAGLCGVRPFAPWLDARRVVSFRWTPLRRRWVLFVTLLVAATVIVRAGSVMRESRQARTDDRALDWVLARARSGELVALEGPGRTRIWSRDPRVAGRLHVVGIPRVASTAPPGGDREVADLYADFGYVVLGSDVPEVDAPDGGDERAAEGFRRSMVDAWGPATVFGSDSLRGPTLWVLANPSDAPPEVGMDADRFDVLERALRDDVRAFLGALGDAHVSGGEGERALEVYAAATELCPDDEAGFYNYGAIAIELGRYEEAVPALERAIALRGDRAESYNNLGIARAEVGDLDGAIEALEVAVRLDPTHRNARLNLEAVREMKRAETTPSPGH